MQQHLHLLSDKVQRQFDGSIRFIVHHLALLMISNVFSKLNKRSLFFSSSPLILSEFKNRDKQTLYCPPSPQHGVRITCIPPYLWTVCSIYSSYIERHFNSSLFVTKATDVTITNSYIIALSLDISEFNHLCDSLSITDLSCWVTGYECAEDEMCRDNGDCGECSNDSDCESYEVCGDDGDCGRDCSAFQIDDYLMDCSVEFGGNENDIASLQSNISEIDTDSTSKTI